MYFWGEGGWHLMVNFYYLIYNWLFMFGLNKVLCFYKEKNFVLIFYLSVCLSVYLQVPCLPFFNLFLLPTTII